MGELIGAVISLFALAVSMLSGVALAGAYEAKATLSAITVQAAADMAIDGGYTSSVQQAIAAALAAHNLNGQATVVVMANNGNSTNTALYGQTFTIWITYQLPVILPNGAVTVPITTSAPGISTYPCAPAQAAAGTCTAPASIPAGSP